MAARAVSILAAIALAALVIGGADASVRGARRDFSAGPGRTAVLHDCFARMRHMRPFVHFLSGVTV